MRFIFSVPFFETALMWQYSETRVSHSTMWLVNNRCQNKCISRFKRKRNEKEVLYKYRHFKMIVYNWCSQVTLYIIRKLRTSVSISLSDVNILELLLEIIITYLLFHMLAIGIDYMPTYIYQIPSPFRFAKCHAICILLRDLFLFIYFFNSDLFPE